LHEKLAKNFRTVCNPACGRQALLRRSHKKILFILVCENLMLKIFMGVSCDKTFLIKILTKNNTLVIKYKKIIDI